MDQIVSKRFMPVLPASELTGDGLVPVEIYSQQFLVVSENGQIYVIENKCGHHEMPLEKGDVENGTIFCPYHRISFDLSTGEVSNRPWENCDPIKVFETCVEDGYIGVVI